MRCEDFKPTVGRLFHEGSLPDGERRALDEHAASCAPCGRFLEVARELPCREFIEFLDSYLENRLEPARREVFELHLSICDDCQAYIESYRRTMWLTGEALGGAAPPLPEDLLRAILAARSARD